MIRRCLAGGFALVSLAAVSGCSAETAERCVERFEKLLSDDHRVTGADLREGRFQPIFTYDVTHMEGVLEHFVGEGDELKGLRGTISQGDSRAALDAFYNAEVPPKGAFFAADGFSLFRAWGTPGSRDAALVEGCRETPPDARLIQVHWVALPRLADGHAPTR